MEAISVEQLYPLFVAQSVCLIDVREKSEYEDEHIAHSILLPLTSFTPSQVPQTQKQLVFVCRSGGRSARAASAYEAAFPDRKAYNLSGGILDWENAGYPVE